MRRNFKAELTAPLLSGREVADHGRITRARARARASRFRALLRYGH